MKRLMIAAAGLLLVGSVFQGTALAQPDHPKMKVRFWAGVECRCVLSDDDTFPDPVFGTAELEAAHSAFGLGGDIEFRLAKFFSFDVGLGYSSTSVKFLTLGWHWYSRGRPRDDAAFSRRQRAFLEHQAC